MCYIIKLCYVFSHVAIYVAECFSFKSYNYIEIFTHDGLNSNGHAVCNTIELCGTRVMSLL